MNGDLIVKIIVALIGGLITYFLIPWLKTKVEAEKLEKFRAFVEDAVRAMEQLLPPEEYKKKKEEVKQAAEEYLAKIGLKLTDEQIELIIEGIVNAVKHPNTENLTIVK